MKYRPTKKHFLLCILLFSSTISHSISEAWGQFLAGIIGTVGVVTTFFKKDLKAMHYVTKALHEPEILDYLNSQQKKQPQKMDFQQVKMGYMYARNAKSYDQILTSVRTAIKIRDNPLTLHLTAFALQCARNQPNNPEAAAKIRHYSSNISAITQQRVHDAMTTQQQPSSNTLSQSYQAFSNGCKSVVKKIDQRLMETEGSNSLTEERINERIDNFVANTLGIFSSTIAQNYRKARLKEKITTAATPHYRSQHERYRSEQLMRIKQGNQDGFSFSNDLDRIK